jgi:AcrR family transcriptional regulator
MNYAEGAPSTPRGRRPGPTRTRQQILDVARRRFLAEGYQAVTLRSVATEVGVDVALVSYHFGSKKGLFGAALGLAANPPEVMAAALPGDPAGLPERVLRALLAAWDDPQRGAQLRLLVGAATQEPDLARLLTEVLQREMFGRLADTLPGPHAAQRAAAFGTQLAGVVFARYVLRLEPVASLSVDELIRHLVPGLRATLYPPPNRLSRRASSGRPGY